mgnify:CR=1 FL=1
MIAINKEEPPNALEGLNESRLAELVKGYRDAHAWDELLNLHMIILNYQLLQVDSDHPQLIQTYFHLAYVWNEKEEYDNAIHYYQSAKAIILQEKNQREYQLAFSYDSLGKAHAQKKEYDQALACFESALEGFRGLSGQSAQDKVAGCYNNIGETLRRKGLFDDAIGYLEKALEMSMQLVGEDDEKTAMTLGNLGKLQVQKGNPGKGLTYLQEAERIFLKWRDPQHPNVKKAQEWIEQAKQDQAVH